MIRKRNRELADAELDITSFMNLMIVLVPVLLLSLVFNQMRILQVQLPLLSSGALAKEQELPQKLELEVHADKLVVNYPAGQPLREIPPTADGKRDFKALALFLQDLKLTFQQKQIVKQDITLLLADNTDYQTMVTTMDTVRSFKTVVAASVVDAELFPKISFADLPKAPATTAPGVQP
ncbi:MAG: biopolymer transporter ExbD [Gammaproteobacteria bacterium]|nr:biopolymer transporter ExbD [Gammaproteobacteria bacterium]